MNKNLFDFAKFDESAAERTAYSHYSYWRSTLQVFWRNKLAKSLFILIASILVFTIIQPLLPNQKLPTKIYTDSSDVHLRNMTPSGDFWFGTNSIGQDLWARIWSGTRTSLFIGLMVALIGMIIGVVVGTLWGYVRSLDKPLTALYNVMDNIPSTIVLILMTYILRPGLKTMILAMCLTSWLEMARLVRNLIIIIRDREYNLASRCLGTPTPRIIYKNLLPYLVSIIMLRVAMAIPYAIGSEVFLTYIGLGLPLSIPSLGNLINEGRILMTIPNLRYQLIIPSIVLSVITISFYVMGNSFADAADPKNHM